MNNALFHSILAITITTSLGMAFAQTQTQRPTAVIQGIVQSQQTPIPGASVSATNSDTGEKITTVTDVNGQYSLTVTPGAKYTVETTMAAFASSTKDADLTDTPSPVRLDFELNLRSRSRQESAPAAGARGARFPNRGPRTPPAQNAEEAPPAVPAFEETNTTEPEGALPGITPDAPTESVVIEGNTAQSTFGNDFNLDRERIQQIIDGRFGPPPGEPGAGPGGLAGGGGPGGPGFGGGPPGGPGGRGGGPGGGFIGFGGRGRGGFNNNRPRGNVSYTLGDSAFDAAPYSLTGIPTAKPAYSANRFSATIGGPLNIPKIYSSPNTAYTASYTGSRTTNPYDVFSTVPTLAERLGDFSQSGFQVFDPQTKLPFSNNVIPSSSINPAAAGLLAFIPKPNLPGSVQNFHFVTSTENNSDDINIRLNHTFGATANGRGGRGGRGGFGGRGGGGAGGRGGGQRPSNLNFGLQYRRSESVVNNPFPSVGGNTSGRGLNVNLGYVRPFGRIVDNFRVSYNRNRNTTSNLYAFNQNVAGNLGINGVSTDPFDWGIPNLSFTNFTGLNDVRPALRRDQTIQISNGMIWNRGKHVFRFGGDFRLIQSLVDTSQNPRGSFTFTGSQTAALNQGQPVQGTGFDFADFLLGLPQLTSLQFGQNSYDFRGNSWDLYLQDDWRLRPSLTLNLGVRYEYVSPFRELNNRIVNLDVAPGFTAVVPVLPGQSGAFTGSFPSSLVRPDRNNWAPRIGIAWRAAPRTVVRAGYGINYNTGAYANIVQQLAFQPPFSMTQTNIASQTLPLTLQNGFPVPAPAAVTNNFGVDRNYALGYVQIWNVDIQRDLAPLGAVLNFDYTGTKGTHLDILQAPNRTPTGVRIPDVQPFTWETSNGNSTANAATVRLRRRFQRGFSVGGSYTFSKSIDNASSIGGAASGIVAQDAFNLAAERGLSSFDQTHRLTVDYVIDLPAGHDKRWFANTPVFRGLFGDWQLSGNWNYASGTPLTVRVLGSFTDVNRGSNGSLRANATGLPIDISDPNTLQWFNIAAFTVPAAGQFGDVGRNTLRGPATSVFGMSMNKTFPLPDGRAFEIRAQATNVFNAPQFRSIDTVVNSPSFGRVTSVGSMRKIQIIARFRF